MSQTKAPPIVLIGGSGRSGTNITKQVLGQHSRVHAMPFEQRFTVDPDGLVDFYDSFNAAWSPYIADVRLKRLQHLLDDLGGRGLRKRVAGSLVRLLNPRRRWLAPPRYHGWRLASYFPNYRQQVEELMSELTEFSYPAAWVGSPEYAWRAKLGYSGPREQEELARIMGRFVNALAMGALEKFGKDVFVEDNTWNILFARQLLEFTPQAKLLHVVRDPRDVVASLMKQRWAPSTAPEAATWLQAIMERWFEVHERLPKGSFMEVRLEDIVDGPRMAMTDICEFSGVEFEEGLLAQDLSQSHAGRWKAEISGQSVERIEPMLAPILDEYGYR